MKEATGELNMTVVALVAVAAIGALFYFAVWPMVQTAVMTQTCHTYGSDYKAVDKGVKKDTGTGNAKVHDWQCCKDNGNNSYTDCIAMPSD